MSKESQGQDLHAIAQQAEADLNSTANKQGGPPARGGGDSTLDSGVDDSVTSKFPGSTVTIGSAASGAGGNRDIPASEGGGEDKETGRTLKARDFEGVGGPEEKAEAAAAENPGDDGVRGNIR